MITFKEFLAEEDQPQTLVDFVQEHCQPFLKYAGLTAEQAVEPANSLWRGMHRAGGEPVHLEVDGEPQLCTIRTTRKDRIPLDTHPDVNDAMNAWFKKEYGYNARNEGIFCFGANGKNMAQDFGRSYNIYPIGKIHALWSDKVVDLAGTISGALQLANAGPISKDTDYTPEMKAKMVRAVRDSLNRQNYRDDGLLEAIHSDKPREILIECDSYLAVRK
jgi:hypothetical protein